MLKTRITTAIISLVILGAVLFVVPAAIAELIIALLIVAGAWEWSGFLRIKSNGGRYLYAAIIAALMAVAVSIFDAYTEQVLQVACAWWFVAFARAAPIS